MPERPEHAEQHALHARVLVRLGQIGGALADSTAAPWRTGRHPDFPDGGTLWWCLDGTIPTPACPGFDQCGCTLRRVDDPAVIHQGGVCAPVATDVGRADAEVIVGLRNTASAVLAGRRRIIERHAPSVTTLPHYVDQARTRTAPACDGCDGTWPCDDYRDAAADLVERLT